MNTSPRSASSLLSLALLLAAGIPSRTAALDLFVKIEPAKSPAPKGESVLLGREAWIPAESFDYQVTTPTDPATGLASGKTRFGFVSFVKTWGASSPQLFQLLSTNETLKSVIFEFTRPSATTAEIFYRVTLSNARIVNLRQEFDRNGGQPSDSISLAYQTILVESVTGRTSAIGEPGILAARTAGSAFGLSYSMVNGDFKVALPDEEVELRFLDLNGALVKSLSARGGEVRFDARTLGVQPGMYLLKASVAGQSLGTVPVSVAK